MRKKTLKLALITVAVLTLFSVLPGEAAPLGPTLVYDINPGTNWSNPLNLGTYHGKLFFAADNGGGAGQEVWVYDPALPTGIGNPKMLKDINGGGNSNPYNFIVYENKLYFGATDSANNYEMWVYDDSLAVSGTNPKVVAEINPGSGSNPESFTLYNGKIFFTADNGSDGLELYSYSGSGVPTQIKNIDGANDGVSSTLLTAYNGKLYYSGQIGTNDFELMRYDDAKAVTGSVGSCTGGFNPCQVANIDGSGDSDPWNHIVYHDKLLFSADTSSEATELWVYDSSVSVGPSNPKLVKDINPSGGSNPDNFYIFKDRVFFSAQGSFATEPWISDGTSAGTYQLKDLNPTGHGAPAFFVEYHGKLYFTARNATLNREWWVTDGSLANTQMVVDLYPGGDGAPLWGVVLNKNVYFGATEGATAGRELYTYSNTEIFSDGFELGDLGGWSNTKGTIIDGDYLDEGKCKLCVERDIALEGEYGLKVRIPNKKPHYIQDNSPDGNDHYRARFNIQVKGLKLKKGKILIMQGGQNAKKQPFRLQIRRKGKKIKIRALVKTDAGKFVRTKWATLPKTNATVEVDWMAAKNKSKHNGYIKLYINGKLARKRMKVNNDKLKINWVRLGVTQKLGAASKVSGYFILDNFASDFESYIGP